MSQAPLRLSPFVKEGEMMPAPPARKQKEMGSQNFTHSSTHPLAIEEPLEIRLEYIAEGTPQRKSVSITMRTPGNDHELAAGFLFTEGVIAGWEDIKHIRSCGPVVNGQNFRNIVRVEVYPHVSIKTDSMERNFYTTSSCGICGKTSIEALKIHNQYGMHIKHLTAFSVNKTTLLNLSEHMRSHQHLFQQTGGCHASALFDKQGKLLCLREDVGRHNALDKVLGWALKNGHLPLHHQMALVSGRASFELMQKASMGGIPLVAAVGAPSTLAVQVAKEFNITLIGFLTHDRFTTYHDTGRIHNLTDLPAGETHGQPLQQNGHPVKTHVGSSARKS